MTEQSLDILKYKLQKYYTKLNSGRGDLYLYQKKIYYYEQMIGGDKNIYEDMPIDRVKSIYDSVKSNVENYENLGKLLAVLLNNIRNNINFDIKDEDVTIFVTELIEYKEIIQKIRDNLSFSNKIKTPFLMVDYSPGKLLNKCTNIINKFIIVLGRKLSIPRNLLKRLHGLEILNKKKSNSSISKYGNTILRRLQMDPELQAKIIGIQNKPTFQQLNRLFLLNPIDEEKIYFNLNLRRTEKETKEKEELLSLYNSYINGTNDDKLLDAIENLLKLGITQPEKVIYGITLTEIEKRNNCKKTFKFHMSRCNRLNKIREALNIIHIPPPATVPTAGPTQSNTSFCSSSSEC